MSQQLLLTVIQCTVYKYDILQILGSINLSFEEAYYMLDKNVKQIKS